MLGGKCSACGEHVELKLESHRIHERWWIPYTVGFLFGALAAYFILN